MIRIIPLAEEYIDKIVKIERESFGDPWSKKLFVDLIDNPLAVCFVAVEDAEVAGYLIAYQIIDEIQILNIAVKESKRNGKIATELFNVIFEYAKIESVKEFTLEVRQSNIGAIALYKKLGFKIDGMRKNYYKNPKEDAILMSLKLGELKNKC
ncbi:MAG: ribosomal protein S18-alanine N-acetyltransferase [Oscillospiraceae bacterium]|nr:ribosomal protein S18-alanine N-acetyltransferase [Oscillospiraceae bacterium]